MSIKTAFESSLTNTRSHSESKNIGGGWTRNPSWISLPAVANTDQKIVGVCAVYNANSNFIAFTIAGNYTVDWGDGSSENVSSGVTAYHEYSYADADLNNTNAPVTLTDAGDLISRTAHGYSNGMQVQFYNIVSTTGLTEAQTYYVINANANDFQVSETKDGSAVTLTTDGSATLLPYKQALITITPQGGANLTSVNFNVKHNKTNLQIYSTGLLDMVLSIPQTTSLTFGAASPTVSHNNLERIRILSCAVTTFANKFQSLSKLTYFEMYDVSTSTNYSNMFNNCFSLSDVRLINISGATNMGSMFLGCSALKEIPLFNTANVTSMASMFSNCSALKTVPLFNTANVTSMASMFVSCSALKTVPLFNTAGVTSMSSMFQSCYALETVPLFNTANVNDMGLMFSACYSLKEIPLFNTANVTSMTSMFSNCSALKTVPLFNTANVASMVSMFTTCSALQTVPSFNTANVTSMATMFNNCSALETVPFFNTANVTSMTTMFGACYSLKEIPLFNTANVTSMASMFTNCTTLQTIPSFNTASATNLSTMFNGLLNLRRIPALNCASIIASSGFSNMLTTCRSVDTINLTNVAVTLSVTAMNLSKPALESFFDRLAKANTVAGATLTITSNHGLGNSVSKSCTTTAGSNNVTISDTVGITTGMQITGGGSPITANVAVTFTDAGDLVNATAHGLQNNDQVSFNSIVSTTGLIEWTTYYVINANANDFQVSDTIGGSAKTLTTNGSGQLRYKAVVDSIVANTSITLSRPAAISNTSSHTFRELITAPALLKQWTISG